MSVQNLQAPRGANDLASRRNSAFSDSITVGLLSVASFAAWAGSGIDIGIQTLSYNQLFSTLAFLFAMAKRPTFYRALPSETRKSLTLLTASSVLIIVLALASITVAREPFDCLRFTGRFVYGLLFLFATISVSFGRPNITEKLARAFIYGGVATTLVCIVGTKVPALGARVFQDLYNYRAMGFLYHPNQLAIMYSLALPIALWRRLFNMPFRLVLIGGLLVGLLMTGSKTNILIAMLVLPVFFVWIALRERRFGSAYTRIIVLVPIMIVLVAAAVFIIRENSQAYYEKLITFFNDPQSSDTASIRYIIWGKSIKCFEHSPFIGIGAANANECIDFPHAHNLFINYLLEMGLFGLFAVTAFWALLFNMVRTTSRAARRLWRADSRSVDFAALAAIGMALMTFFVANQTSDSMGPAVMQGLWVAVSLLILVSARVHRAIRAQASGAAQVRFARRGPERRPHMLSA